MFLITKMHKRFLLLTMKVVNAIMKMTRIVVITTMKFVNRDLKQI